MDEEKETPAGDVVIAPPPVPYQPYRRKIAALPEHLRAELDRHLSRHSFHSCRSLSKWLRDNGYTISHAAIHKYGQSFDRHLEAVRRASEQARSVCEQFKDDDESMQNALMRLVQSQLFQMLVAVNETSKRNTKGSATDLVPINLPALARSVAGLLKVDVERRRWSERTRAKIVQASEVLEAAKSDGLGEDVVSRIRDVLMAIEE